MTIKLRAPETTELRPRITVLGVGGAGGNAVNNMIASKLEGVDFVVANTDAQSLQQSKAQRRIQIGAQSGDHEITLFVRDNGAGIDIKHRERAFDGHNPSQNPAEPDGSEIGLAYVQRIIQRHGGRTWTEAVPDGGATFCFSLPDESAEPEFRAQRR